MLAGSDGSSITVHEVQHFALNAIHLCKQGIMLRLATSPGGRYHGAPGVHLREPCPSRAPTDSKRRSRTGSHGSEGR
jgi:hypothetical protein